MPHLVPDLQPDGTTNIALPWYQARCSVIPIRTDGTKKPRIEWKPLIEARPTPEQVTAWFQGTNAGVAVVCGQVSGNLEMLELEGRASDAASIDKIVDACIRHDVLELWETLTQQGYAEWTPSGGLHLIYRVNGGAVPGNTKLAHRPATTEELAANPKDLWKVLAETRGEGGYVIVAPTGGHCHESGEAWTTIAGAPGTIPLIFWPERCRLHQAITEALDVPKPVPPPRSARPALSRSDGSLSPGDDYAARTDWADLLEPQGWQLESTRGTERMWTRPGKDPRLGSSATTDYMGKPGLYVFSSAAGLPTETPLTKLFVYAHYHCNGDMVAAARDLVKQGFGSPAVPRPPANADFMGNAVVPYAEFVPGATTVTLPNQINLPAIAPDLKFFTYTDVGNGERLAALAGDRFRYVSVRDKWMYWNGACWTTDYKGSRITHEAVQMGRLMLDQAKADGDEAFTKFAHRCLNSDRVGAAIKMLRAEPSVWAEPDDFDADRNIINLHNGVFNLVTGELVAHDPKFMCTKKMNAGFDPQATAPQWQAYLDQVLPDPAVQKFVQKMVGYTLSGNPVQRALALLHGPGGTGKSRFVEILAHLFGSYGATAAESLFKSKREASGPTNDLNDLRGARMASVSELDNGIRMDETLVKRLTGFDRVTSRGLFEENQTWMPQCVIWLATNHLPRINSDDGAIWDRMKVIPFREQITNRDPFILDKLIKEADGIFNWILEGLVLYLEEGLDMPDSVRSEVVQYRSEQDSALQFVEDSLSTGRLHPAEPNDPGIDKGQLFAMFRQWCSENQEAPLGRIRFERRIVAMGYTDEKRGRWFWLGLKQGSHGVLGTMA